jgi:DNA-binding MarR family transcriptional regulator
MNSKGKENSMTLELLEAIEEKSDVTQRRLARELGVALGLANSYLKRCERKGLVKIHKAPANRYLYYLTPKGFAEKSRLTAEYLSASFSLYRWAVASCAEVFERCRRGGWSRITLCGASELAEIASLRAQEHNLRIAWVYDEGFSGDRFLSCPVAHSVDEYRLSDAWVVTALADPQAYFERLKAELPRHRMVAPRIYGLT